MPDNEYLASLQILIARIDAQDTAAERRETAADRREELLMKINGHVREHGERLAAHKQWIWGHKQTHEDLDKDMRCLSNKLWILSGGSGVLAMLATILQAINL